MGFRRVAWATVIIAIAWAAPAHAAGFDGASLTWPWTLPFAGLLMSIAAGPLLFPKIWHDHYGKIAALWAALTLVPLALFAGPAEALDAFLHAMLGEYMSFILLLLALFTVAGGILVTGNFSGRPLSNAAILLVGTMLASFVGTTGAAMILIRPLLRANIERRHNAHVVVFFIFLVANIGGALTPLGDPPLLVGFLRGVDFFWTMRHLLVPTACAAGALLLIFLALDSWLSRREGRPASAAPATVVRVRGWINVPLMAAIIAAILLSAVWSPGIRLTIRSTGLELQNLVRDAAFIVIAIASLVLTPDEHRAANDFSWEPIREVAKLFAAIFVCIIPVVAMLDAGERGAFAWLINAVTDRSGAPHQMAYFWLTGALSALLDNAPAYLLFFELAGGDAGELMGPFAGTLAAISMGAVYMGAMTYIGNAPNLMVYALATERGIRMPSFFGYVGWAAAFLLPVLAAISAVFVGR